MAILWRVDTVFMKNPMKFCDIDENASADEVTQKIFRSTWRRVVSLVQKNSAIEES